MPILSYFAVVGSVLVALLFAADATLPKSGPIVASSEFYGVPKPWKPDPAKHILVATPAPEPDMTSAAVTAAAPVKVAAVAAPETTAKAAEPAPKKKRVARKNTRPDHRQNFAWRNGNDSGFFGGGGNSMFGRL